MKHQIYILYIYKICDNVIYVGYTGDDIRTRWRNHKSHIKMGYKTWEIASHFKRLESTVHKLNKTSQKAFTSELSEHFSVLLIVWSPYRASWWKRCWKREKPPGKVLSKPVNPLEASTNVRICITPSLLHIWLEHLQAASPWPSWLSPVLGVFTLWVPSFIFLHPPVFLT